MNFLPATLEDSRLHTPLGDVTLPEPRTLVQGAIGGLTLLGYTSRRRKWVIV